jgi:hypothetical protein
MWRVRALRAPIAIAAVLVFAGVGYAAYGASSTAAIGVGTASFSIVYTNFSDTGAPPNIVTFTAAPLPSPSVLVTIGDLVGGQTIYIWYTVEDMGSLAATGVTEQPTEIFTNCDGTLALAQVGLAPTTLAPMTPQTAELSITDYAAAGGPSPPGCPAIFGAEWLFNVSGHPV